MLFCKVQEVIVDADRSGLQFLKVHTDFTLVIGFRANYPVYLIKEFINKRFWFPPGVLKPINFGMGNISEVAYSRERVVA